VSEELAKVHTFCFFIDLADKRKYSRRKNLTREVNLKLINLMITKIPNESKFCVSYGQLKDVDYSCNFYTRTTKEGDKDYIVRASLSPDLDLDLHKVFFRICAKYVKQLEDAI
jgi:hypothetical protein